MSGPQKNGWADLVDLDDEKTPPDAHTVVAPTQPTPVGRVSAPAGRPSGAPRAKAETPGALRLPSADELTGGLSLEPPRAPARGPLSLDSSERPTERLPPSSAGRPPERSGFSNAVLLEKLRTEPGSPAVGNDWRAVWVEYRELILTGVIGVLLLAGFVGYRAMNREPTGVQVKGGTPVDRLRQQAPSVAPEASAPSSVAPSPSPVKSAAAELPPTSAAPVSAPATPAATPEPSEVTRPASVAMLSVLSQPPGAEIFVNGEPAGKTPLIAKAPAGAAGAVVHVRLTMPGYQAWDQTLSPNESGHYVANVTLEH
ncbi:MAG: PEGA domain-containing protein [Myxococcota bacterium]